MTINELETRYIAAFGPSGGFFARLAPKAIHLVENATTGVDGYIKLREAYPTDEADSGCVMNCIIEIIHALHELDIVAETAAMSDRGDGALMPKVIASMSSGNESISFSTSQNSGYMRAATNAAERQQLINGIIRDNLSGVRDKNGVNLLYRGAYPYV